MSQIVWVAASDFDFSIGYRVSFDTNDETASQCIWVSIVYTLVYIVTVYALGRSGTGQMVAWRVYGL